MTETELQDIEAIRRLKARYFRFLDTKQWQEWRGLFTADVSAVVDGAVTTFDGDGRPELSIVGADEFVEYAQTRIGSFITVHHGHTPEIELTSTATAKGAGRWKISSSRRTDGFFAAMATITRSIARKTQLGALPVFI